MPQMVVPTPDSEGNKRTWDQVFPIWKNDDDNTEWRIINEILESIDMTSRYGCSECSADTEEGFWKLHRQHLLKMQFDYFTSELAKPELNVIHNHKEEFAAWEGQGIRPPEEFHGHTSYGCTKDCEILISHERQAILDQRKKLYLSYGLWTMLINQVFDNYGASWRE